VEAKFASDETKPEADGGAGRDASAAQGIDPAGAARDRAPLDEPLLPAATPAMPPSTDPQALGALADLEAELLTRRDAGATGAELGEVFGRLADAQARLGFSAEALATYREASEALRASDEYGARAALIGGRADLERQLGMFVEAQRSFAEAAQAFAMARDELSCAGCWYSVGAMRERTNRASGAAEAYEQAVRLYAQAGAALEQAQATFALARTMRAAQPRRALGLFAQARDLCGTPGAAGEDAAAPLPEVVDDPRSLPVAALAAACEREVQGLAAAGVTAEPGAAESSSWTRAEVTAKKRTPLPLLITAALAVVVALYAALAPSTAPVALEKPAAVYRPPSVATGELREMPAPARQRAEGLLAAAAQSSAAGNYDDAVRAYDQAIEMFRQGKRREGEADGLRGRAEMEMARARADEARRLYRELLGVYRELGDTAAQMGVLQALIAIDQASGGAAALRESYERVLALHEQAENRDGQVDMLRRLVALELEGGRLGAAREALTRLRLLYDSVGDAVGKAATLESLAAIDMQVGRVARARDQLNQAFVIYRESGAAADQARALVGLGDIDRGERRPEQARASYRQALRLYEDGGDATGRMATRLRLGDIESDLGHGKRAAGIYAEVLQECEGAGDDRCMANALRHLGRLQAEEGDARAAIAAYTRAAELLAQSGDAGQQVEVLAALAELRDGDPEASRLWAEASELSARLDDPDKRAAALAAIAAAALRSGRADAARDGYSAALGLYETSHNVVGQMAALKALQGLTSASDAESSRRYAAQLASLQTETDASLRD